MSYLLLASALSGLLAMSVMTNISRAYLASPGGNLYEGMKHGLLFRQHRIKTVVEGGSDCASACALAFLGGTDSEGRPWRSSSSNSRLGFHAFRGISERAINEDEVQRTAADNRLVQSGDMHLLLPCIDARRRAERRGGALGLF